MDLARSPLFHPGKHLGDGLCWEIQQWITMSQSSKASRSTVTHSDSEKQPGRHDFKVSEIRLLAILRKLPYESKIYTVDLLTHPLIARLSTPSLTPS
ncbi:hypothetical protein NW767_005854 [Fusarium falciforme]|nr:hypothetical protein NW767_005854 [Fusarium falciforme]